MRLRCDGRAPAESGDNFPRNREKAFRGLLYQAYSASGAVFSRLTNNLFRACT